MPSSFTNFPNGITSLGIPVVGSGSLPIGANYFFVSSVTGNSGNTGSYDSPMATIGQAVALCTAAQGDTIVVMEGHAETISTAGGLAINKSGIFIVGQGTGNNRPVLTFATSTAATCTITAANVNISNIVATTSIDSIVSPFVISAAGVTLGIEWQDASSTVEAVRAVLTTAACDNLTLNLRYIGFPAGDAGVNAVRLVGVNDATLNLNVYGKFSTAVVEFLTTACTDINIYGYMYNSGTTDGSKDVVDTATGSTWFVSAFDGASGATVTGGSAAAIAGGGSAARNVVSTAAAMVNGNTIFTVAGGPIKVEALVSLCVTTNDGTASTLQYSATPTVGSATTFSGASASLASAAAGATVTLAGTALATAALLSAGGPNLIANPGTIVVPAGTIKMVIGTGSTTGTWRHYMRYVPLTSGVTVV